MNTSREFAYERQRTGWNKTKYTRWKGISLYEQSRIMRRETPLHIPFDHQKINLQIKICYTIRKLITGAYL